MHITVVGHAQGSYAPERATLRMRLGVEGGDKQSALEHTTSLVQSFSTAVEHLKNLSPSPTTWSAVSPIGTRSWRPWTDDGTVPPIRHRAECSVQLKFRDFRALAAFIDQWGGRDGVTVDGVEWTLTEDRRATLESRVLEQAVERARARATTIACAAGEQSVRFLEAADEGLLASPGAPSPDRMMYGTASRMMSGAEQDGIEIVPEDVVLHVTLHVRFSTD